MRHRPRWFLAATCFLVLLLLAVSLFLPAGFELQRSRVFPHPTGVLHPWLATPERWEAWAPAWMAPGSPATRITAALPKRGVWCDVPALGPRLAKSALLYSKTDSGEGTRLTWILRTDVGLDPLRRWSARFAQGRVGAQMEAALERLAGQLP